MTRRGRRWMTSRSASRTHIEGLARRTEREFRKLKQMSPKPAEATVVRNYIDWMRPALGCLIGRESTSVMRPRC